MTAGGWFGTLTLFVLGVLFLANRPLADAASDWHGFSAWWAVIPFALLVLLALMRANYEEFKTLHHALNASEDDREKLETRAEQQPQGQTVVSGHTLIGNVATGNHGDGFHFSHTDSRWDPDTPLQTMASQSFANQTVALDGYDFVGCEFLNVVFSFRGERPFSVRSSYFAGGINFEAPEQYLALLKFRMSIDTPGGGETATPPEGQP